MRRAGVVAAMALICAGGLYAQQHPNLVKGFDPKGVFHSGEYDSINTWNGNLTISIPLGPAFPLDGGKTFQLSLHSNSGVWDVEKYNGSCDSESTTWTVAYAHRRANAGMGWTMTPGRLFSPGHVNSSRWVYESPDGADHEFRLGDGGYVTLDGTYTLLKHQATAAPEVHFPDGTVHRFEEDPNESGAFRLTTINSNRGGTLLPLLTFTYPSPTMWVITSAGNKKLVTVTMGAEHYETPPSAVPATKMFVQTVTFHNSHDAGQTYTFHYAGNSFQRPVGLHTVKSQCWTQWVYVTFLEAVDLPDGTSFRFEYVKGGAIMDSGLPIQMTLPTGGRVAWAWGPGMYDKPQYSVFGIGWMSNVIGVKSRTVYDRNSTTGATWNYQVTYDNDAHPDQIDKDHYAAYQKTTIEDPDGRVTEAYFCVEPEENYFPIPTATSPHYGLPFSRLFPDGNGRFRSTRVIAGGTIREEAFVRYERDEHASQGPAVNTRVAARNVVRFEDGRCEDDAFDSDPCETEPVSAATTYKTNVLTESTEYKEYGRYRVQTISGTALPGLTRTTTTEYTNPAAGGPWRTNLYTSVTTTDTVGAVAKTSSTTFVFNAATGFLEEKRTTRNGGSSDLQVKYTDDGKGNVQKESYHGGDGAPNGGTCSAGGTTPCYELHHVYDNGSLTATTYGKPLTGGGLAAYASVSLGIDPHTRQIIRSTDPAGRSTTYAYDPLGRIAEVRPPASAWTLYTYTAATTVTPASVTVAQYPENSAAGAANELTKSVYYYDGFGRLLLECRKMPEGWAKSWTRYDLTGRPTFAYSPATYHSSSDYTPYSATSHFTAWTYDTLGRVRTVTLPDLKQTEYTYSARETTRKTTVAAQAPSADGTVTETPVLVREKTDGFGRLVSVVENAGAAAAEQYVTTYQYGLGDRLTNVSVNGQSRMFDYDAAGLLVSETHPESGTTKYTYDARGHVLTRTAAHGTPDADTVTYRYDFAERPVSASNAAGLLKEFAYDADAASYGKVSTARRHNRLGAPYNDVVVEEAFVYEPASGRLSSKTTSVAGQTFTDKYGYDPLGAANRVDYPACAGCGGVAGPPRSINTTRVNGLTTAVGNYTSLISYHANGLVHEIAHRNEDNSSGPRYVLQSDAGMARPASISIQQYCGDLRSVTIASDPVSTTNLAPGANVQLTASASGPVTSWEWYQRTSSGDVKLATTTNQLTVQVTATTSYFARARNDTCSTDSPSVTVATCDAAPAVNAPASTTASMPTTVSVAPVSGATYAWSVSANATISGSSTGSTMTFIANCPNGTPVTATVVITSGCGPQSTSATIAVESPTAVVSGSAVVASSGATAPVTVVLTGKGPWTLQWTGQSSTTTAWDAETQFQFGPGTYSLASATDANGCPATVSGTAVISVAGSGCALDATIQSNKSQFLASDLARPSVAPVTGATYTWQVIGQGTVESATNLDYVQVRAKCSGTFTVTVTIAKTGCTSVTSSRTFAVTPPSVEIRPADRGPFTYREGDPPPVLKAWATSYRGTFRWSDGVTSTISLRGGPFEYTRNATPGTSGTYSLIGVTDENGCTGSVSGSAQVNYCAKPGAALSAPSSVRASETAAASVTPVTGATYQWSIEGAGTITSAMNTPTVTFQPGCTGSVTLSVTVTAACGAQSTSSTTIAVTSAVATVSGTTTIAQGSSANVDVTLGGTGPWTLTWEGLAPETATTSPHRRIVTPSGTTTYRLLSAVDANGCALAVAGTAVVTVKPPAPGSVIAAAVAPAQIRVSWAKNGVVDTFTVYRDGAPVGETAATVTQYTDTVAAGTAHVYHVVAAYAQTPSDPSARDLATAIVFASGPLVEAQSEIAASDTIELRTSVNAVRALAGLAPAVWTDANLTDQPPKAIHVNELREALGAARVALQFPPVRYWRSTTVPGDIDYAVEIMELRGGVE